MKGNEFLKKVKALAKRRGWRYEWHANEGKGSHGTLYVNGKREHFMGCSSNWVLRKTTYISERSDHASLRISV